MELCRLRIDNLTKPLNSLHSFEHIADKLAGISGNARPRKSDMKKTLVLISHASDSLDKNIDNVVRIFADHVSAELVTFDLPRVECENGNLSQKAIETCICAGICLANTLTGSGTKILGIGVTKTGSDLSQLINSADSIDRDVAGICSILAHHPSGPQIAVLVGLILGAAAGKALIILDGPETALAGYLASRLSPLSKEYLIGSHAPFNLDHQRILGFMNLPTYLHLDLQDSCGIGALLGMSLINASFHILSDMKTFGEADVAVAQDGPGALRQDIRIR
jgi:nicotinate-nucleotide--dimethylbenzimidazole phosphoribosyltransferase